MTAARFSTALALLLVAALGLLLPGLGQAPLERAEIYFLDGARSMLERGDWLVPYYRDAPFFDKPPLTYWLQALSFRLLGPSPAAGRLVSVVAACLALATTAWLGCLVHGRRSALAGVAVLATTLAFVGFGRIAMSDMLLALGSTLAVTLALSAYRGAGWAVPALGVTLGLGFVTKGPVAVLLPGLGIGWLAWRRRDEGLPGSPRALALAALAFAVLAFGWFAALVPRFGLQPLEHFFLQENLQRFAAETYDAGEPPWYYLITYLAEGLPWSLFLPLAVGRAFGRRAAGDAAEDGSRFLAVWLALMLLPLSVSRGKIDYYLLPLYPGAALLVGHHLASRSWSGLDRAWARLALLVLAALLVLPAALSPPLPAAWLPSSEQQRLLATVAGVGAAAALAVALRPRGLRVVVVLGGVTLALFGVVAALYLPAFAAAQPNRAIVADVARERQYVPRAQLVLCEDPTRVQRDVLFHARLPVVERCDLWAFGASDEPWLLLLDPAERASLAAIPGLREVRRYPYLPADRFGLRGLLQPTAAGELVLAANYATSDPVAEVKRRRQRKRALRALDEAGLPHPE